MIIELQENMPDSSLKLARSEGFIQKIASGYRKRSQMWYKLGNYESAYRDYRRFKKYSDSIFNIESSKNIQTLELKYDFEKEKQELKSAKQTETAKKQLYFALFILALSALIIIALLIRHNYKSKARLSKVKYENETLKLAQELENKETNVKQLIADNTMRLEVEKRAARTH